MKEGKKHGFGIDIFKNGDVCIGYFENGNDGPYKVFDASGYST